MKISASVCQGLKVFSMPKLFQSRKMFENIKIIGPCYIESILCFKVFSKKKYIYIYLFIYSHLFPFTPIRSKFAQILLKINSKLARNSLAFAQNLLELCLNLFKICSSFLKIPLNLFKLCRIWEVIKCLNFKEKLQKM